MMTYTIAAVATFNFNDMATSQNNYKLGLPHPMTSEIAFVATSGKRVSLRIGQLATICAIVEKYPNPGKAIDQLFSQLTSEDVTEICRLF